MSLLYNKNASRKITFKDPELRAKRISQALTGRKLSPEHIEKLKKWEQEHPEIHRKALEKARAIKLSYPMSEETKQKLSKALKGKKKSPEHVQKVKEAVLRTMERSRAKFKETWKLKMKQGFKLPEETRERMRQSHLGQRPTEESLTKFRISHMGFDIDQYRDAIIADYQRGISSKEIGKRFGTYQPTIIRSLRRWGIPIRVDGLKHGRQISSKDQHLLLSTVELHIDDFLFEHNIVHSVNRAIPNSKYRYDFYLPEYNIYIEYWGLSELPDYSNNRKIKEDIYQSQKLQLFSIEPYDDLEKKLNELLIRVGKQQQLEIKSNPGDKMFREIMRNPEGEEKDIPEAEVIGKKIKLGPHSYDLIMCYACPICEKPIIVYWQLPPHDNRATENVVERALRDSGFGGFRFFSTESGQGFEYDPVKDPRKRHTHTKSSTPDWRGITKYTELWEPFITLNPVFSVNDFIARIVDPHNSTFPHNFQFISKTSTALAFIRAMENRSGIFQVSKDIMKHGKPIFWFNVVKWDEKIEYRSAADPKMRLDMIAEWIGDDRIAEVNIVSPLAEITSINKRRY